jgi:hypothetical protein
MFLTTLNPAFDKHTSEHAGDFIFWPTIYNSPIYLRTLLSYYTALRSRYRGGDILLRE